MVTVGSRGVSVELWVACANTEAFVAVTKTGEKDVVVATTSAVCAFQDVQPMISGGRS